MGVLNTLQPVAVKKGWQGQARGRSVQAGALAWAASHLSPGQFAVWGPRWQGYPEDQECCRGTVERSPGCAASLLGTETLGEKEIGVFRTLFPPVTLFYLYPLGGRAPSFTLNAPASSHALTLSPLLPTGKV